MSDEQKAAQSERLKGNTFRRGKKASNETRAKISEANKGRPSPMKGKQHTDESKALMAEASRGNQYALGNPSRTGQPHTDETKTKISEALTGKTRTPEQRAGMSGKSPSAETREKQRQAKLGKTHSDETKALISENSKKWWAENTPQGCVECGDEKLPGHARCRKHHNERLTRLRHEKQERERNLDDG